MKWEKENFEEIEEVLVNLNKVKILAIDKLKEKKEKLNSLLREMPEYIEIYKKMKGQ